MFVLPLQSGDNHAGGHFHGHHSCKSHNSASKDLVQSPGSVSGPRDGLLSKVCHLFDNNFDPLHYQWLVRSRWILILTTMKF